MSAPLARGTLTLLTGTEPSPPLPQESVDQILDRAQEAERGGRRAEARAAYERALTLLTPGEGRRASTVLRWIARTHLGDGDPEAALDVLEAAVAVAEGWNDDAAAGSAINVQAVVHWQMGRLDEAERLYLTARNRALRAGDAKLAAMTSQNLGVVANVRGDLVEAQRHYEASLDEYRVLGMHKDVVVALNNLGLLHTHAQRWDDAERAFNEAVQLTEVAGDLSARTVVDVNLAEMWVARGDFPRAQGCVRHAMDAASRSGDAASIGQATKLLGIIARETGDAQEAEEHFRRAEEIAIARHDVLLEAEVAREAGELARRQGRNAQVLRHLNRSHRLFTGLRARRDLADIDRRTGRLEEEFIQVARRWGESIEAKDRYTQGHCVRVADLACAMAAELGMEPQEIFWFRIGALLHDVGKIVIPEEVLNKPGRLTDEEWALMRSHTTAGVDMLAGIEFPWDVLPVIRSHHERWDGQGYPEQLRGEAIPRVARILCVADVYDALTSVRSYKRALTHDAAVELMRRDVGAMFDPVVFAAFERVGREWADRANREVQPLASQRETAPVQALVSGPAGGASVGATGEASNAEASHHESEEAPGDDHVAPAPSYIRELDDLTGMPLRRGFRETAERVLDARRTTERRVSLLVIDIDHFKLVNDTFGHLQGDDVLRRIAGVLREHTRPSDFVARYAGDEFVALLPGTTLEDAIAIAERLRAGAEFASCARRDGDEQPVRVTLSIGVASAPTHGETLDELFAAADGALYASKRKGRNAVTAASGSGGTHEPALLLDGFVGRTAERGRLRRHLDAAASGAPKIVSVVGEAGVGKTMLVRQLAPEIGVRAGSMLVGRCLEADVRVPYGPWADVIGALHLTGLVPKRAWRELGRLVPALGSGTDSVGAGSAARYALMQEIEEYLSAAASVRPLAVILDDMQWADADTWDVLELLATRFDGQRVLICLTVRREDVAGVAAERLARLSRHEHFTEITLGRLSAPELEHWLRGALGGQVPEPALTAYLERHTEGNPLFAVQTLRALAEDGGVRFEEGAWRYRPSPEHSLPTAVRDLLARRIGRLSDRTREVLTTAAVFGSRFDADALIACSTRDEDAVLDALDEGVRALVVAPADRTAATTFEFTHGLLGEVLRRAGNPLRMRRVHERVARELESRPGASAAEIAAHFDRAGCGAEALQYGLRAAERAMAVYAYDAAAHCLSLAERHARTLTDHANVQWQLAALDELVGRYESAESRCASLLTTYAAGTEALGLARVARRMTERLRLLRGAPAANVLAVCEGLHGAATAAGDERESIMLLMMLSQVHSRLGDQRAAERAAHDAIAGASAIDDRALNAEAIMRLGATLLSAAPADAVSHYRRALDLFTALDDRRGQLRCQINVAVACDRAGNHPAAEVAYATALEMGREVKSADLTALASMNLGVLFMKLGRFVEARRRFEDSMRLYASVNNEPLRLGALYNLAHLARERGDSAGATELYSGACHLAARLGQLDVNAGALAGCGLAELEIGQFAAADTRLARARDLLTGREVGWFQGRELLVALEVQLLLTRGDVSAAQGALGPSLELAEQHDPYAAVWLAAACVPAMQLKESSSPVWRNLARKYAVQARALGYAPLQQRLSTQIAALAA